MFVVQFAHAIEAERLGIPAVATMADRFVATARAVSAVNGLKDHPFAVITHPIAEADLRVRLT